MSISASGNSGVDGLLSGRVWGSGAITWSDPRSRFDYSPGYDSDLDRDGWSAQVEGFAALSGRQLATTRFALEAVGPGAGFAVEGFTGLRVTYAGDGGAGDVRLANTGDAPTAYAYLPGGGEYGGDVWFGRSGGSPEAGNHDHLTVLHELGHALGLEHAHEGGRFGSVPERLDGFEFTVMSYRSHIGDSLSGGLDYEKWGAPQTWMMLDIAALQHLYGADFSVNAGDTTYCWTPGSGRTWVDGEVAIDPGANRIFATVWDGGGRDRFDLSAYSTDLRLDLRPGRHSAFADEQLADLGGGPSGGHARGNIFNALQHRGDRRSLIEDATGGSGDDLTVGNAARNRLSGSGGDDVLLGGAGSDRLAGGSGADVFRFRSAEDSAPGRCDRIVREGGAAFEGAGHGGGDLVDLGRIDADATRPGDQAFFFGSNGRGGLWLEESGRDTCVLGNVHGNRAPEFEIVIRDGALRASDYAPGDFVL